MANSVFVSPGVYTSEKDLTFVTRQVGVTTLGLVGETTKGPAFNPVFISDYDEFKQFFGSLNTTKMDNGAPKYELPYIAKSYLSESNQLFVTRVLGYSGYDAGPCWGITLDAAMETSASTVTVTGLTPFFTYQATTAGTITSLTAPTQPLVETLFNNGSLNGSLNTLTSKIIGDTSSTAGVIWDKTNGIFSGVSFTYTLIETGTTGTLLTGTTSASTISYYSGTSYSDVENILVATLRSRGSYDGDEVLNFQCSGSSDVVIVASASTINSPLGQFTLSANSSQGNMTYDVSFDSTNKNYITRVLGKTQNDGKTAIFVEEVYKNMLDDYNPKTNSKVRGINTTIINYGDRFYNNKVQYAAAVTPYVVSEVRGSNIIRLFRLWTISDGNTANSEIKISIENIKPNEKEFDVVIRSYDDTDAKPNKLERFTRCTMNSSADNFIGRKIGTLDGEFTSKSSYVLVELDLESDFNDAFPAGFVGVPQRDNDSVGSVKNPTLTYKTHYDTYDNKRKFYLGLSDSIGYDQCFFNYKGENEGIGAWTALTAGFHMDSGATTATIDGVLESYTFEVGNAEFRTNDGIIGTDYDNIKARKFTLAPYGGFDGWDIYRVKRTNGNDYLISNPKIKAVTDNYPNGVFRPINLVNGDEGNSSDYYAYLEAIRTFSNPEAVNINVFATPGIDTDLNSSLIEETIEMVEQDRADSLYIITVPDTSSGEIKDPANVIYDLNDLFDSNYTATYWPWVQINDAENGQYMWVPPTRDAVRNIARTDNIAYPWFASAGVNRGDVDCIKARVKLTLDERDTLYEGRVNPIATFASEGVKIWGNKTLQVADTALNRINVRRLLLQARKLISAVAIRLLFEQNDDIVRNQFLALVNPILDGIRKERGLTDFRVTVDSSPESIDRNELSGKIYLKPTRSLEYIDIQFNIMPTGASFENI